MSENAFRKALDECLSRLARGDSLDVCLAAHPQLAGQLRPFLQSAATLRGMNAPTPSLESSMKARNRLLDAVAAAGGGKEAVVSGMFRFAHVAAMAAVTLFIAGAGLVAASGGDILTAPFDGDKGESFNARVVQVSTSLMFVQTESDYRFLELNDGTRFEDAAGHEIDRSAVHVGSHLFVKATFDYWRLWDAHLIRWMDKTGDPTPAPIEKPVPAEPTPVQTPKPAPAESPKPEPTKAPTPKPTEKPAPTPGAAVEFWGVVTALSETSLNVDMQGTTPVVVVTNADTQFPTGYPFVNVKVWVLGYKQADGSYLAIKVTVKIAEFSGVVDAVGETQMTVTSGCAQKTVRFDSHTNFPAGFPKAQDSVAVRTYIMADGFLATDVTVKAEAQTVFCGTIVPPEPGAPATTIFVDVGGVVKAVCYENATVYPSVDALVAGKKVEVKVDHFDGSTYFAGPSGYVKVLN